MCTGVLQNSVDSIARQPVVYREVGDAPFAKAKQPVVARAEPKSAVRVFVDCPHLHLRQGGSGNVLNKCSAMHVAEAAVGANPQIAVPVFQQRAGARLREAILLAVADNARMNALSYQMTQTPVGGNPHAFVSVLGNGADEFVCQAVTIGPARRASRGNAVDAISVRTGPQHSRLVAKHIAYMNAAHARQH